MANLNSEIDLDFKKFFRWWKRELKFLVPDWIRQAVSSQHGTIVIRPDPSQIELSFLTDGREEVLETLNWDDSGIARFKEMLAADERMEKADVVLRLSKTHVLQKEFSLPSAAKENLTQVISYELSRFSPFTPEQAYFAVKVLEGPNEPGQIRVMLVLTSKDILDKFIQDLQAFGISPKIADSEIIPNNLEYGEESYNLLPESLRAKVDKTAQWVHGSLMGLVAVLFICALALPVWFEYRSVNDLQAKINAIEKEAKNIKALQAEVDGMVEETNQLIGKKTEKPPVVETLDTLSKLIKDDTFLNYMQYANGQMQMQGESPAASTLISVLEASDIFANAKFVSPVTRDNISKLERFQITVDIVKAGGQSGTDQQH